MKRKAYILRQEGAPTTFDDRLFRTLDQIEFHCSVMHKWNEVLELTKKASETPSLLLIDPTANGVDDNNFRKQLIGESRFKETKIVLIRSHNEDDFYSLEDFLDVDGMIAKNYDTFQISFVMNRLLFPQHANRRRHPRALIKVPGLLSLEKNSSKLNCETIDLSVAGAFIKSDFPLPLDTKIEMQFEIPSLPRPILCKGTVVHNRKGTSEHYYPSGMGILFEDIFASDRSKLFDFISTKFLRIERRATHRSLKG